MNKVKAALQIASAVLAVVLISLQLVSKVIDTSEEIKKIKNS